MPTKAVILAGGKGSRLAPYTTVLPKPLLPIGDRAILEVVLQQLESYGFTDVTLAVGHLAHLVKAVIGGGAAQSLRVHYHEEDEPLGTVGPLATMDGLDEGPFLAMNGDVLTSLDYSDFLAAHVAGNHALTIASHRRTVRIDYGVMHVDERDGETAEIVGFEEKPELPYVVSMGVYAFDPRALEHVEPGLYADLPDLVNRLIAAGESVGSYLFDGYWLDIGRHEDYELAIRQYEELKPMLLNSAGG